MVNTKLCYKKKKNYLFIKNLQLLVNPTRFLLSLSLITVQHPGELKSSEIQQL